MLRSRSPVRVRRLLVLVGLLVAAAVLGVAAASGLVADNGILNQSEIQDPVGDSGAGPDLSLLTITSYADGTVSFSVGFANRKLIQPGESVQVFVDLNDDGKPDLNLSIWPFGDPSYLARWTGSDWVNIRQLPELAQANGSFSVRLSVADLVGAAAVPVGSSIGVLVGAWTGDPASTSANDWLPDSRTWIQHQIAPPAAQPTTTTTPAPPAAPPRLVALCARKHTLRVSVTGTEITSVRFYANGKLRLTDVQAPYIALISTKGLRTPISITASVHSYWKKRTLHVLANTC